MKSEFTNQINTILNSHLPSSHSFFIHLENADSSYIHSEKFLDELYIRYQAAMHATRVMLYFLPYFETVTLRKIKLNFLVADDGLPNGDTHHFQLRRTWSFMLKREPNTLDNEFGSLHKLESSLDSDTSEFIKLIRISYPKNLGAWIVIEGLAHNWIGALLKGLTPHFPEIDKTDYFTENYKNQIELHHASMAIEAACNVIEQHPELFKETIHDAKLCAVALDRLWNGFDKLLQSQN